jgi:hypothetical protein
MIDDGLGISTDGWVVLAYGEALLDPDNTLVVGGGEPQGPTAMSISTSMGPFFVEGSVLQTPFGAMYDLDGLREVNGIVVDDSNIGERAPTTTVVPSAPPSTLAPSSVDPIPAITVPSLTDPLVRTTTTAGG